METNSRLAAETVVVILAAGKGTRMGRSDLVKVCFEIDAVPAINRTIATFQKRRFQRYLLVVGTMSNQVLETVGGDHPGILYVYQEPQLGTGHAARVAAEALANIGYQGNVLVTMGDKFLEEAALDALVDGFVKQQPDLALATLPKCKATAGSGGRVFLDSEGQALDIIETPDLARQSAADALRPWLDRDDPLSAERVRKLLAKHFPNPKKRAVALGELLALAQQSDPVDKQKLQKVLDSPRYRLCVDGQNYSAKQIERLCRGVNPSLYLFRAEAFYQGVGMLENDNAQGEYYLTDVVKCLASVRDQQGQRRFKIRTVPLDHSEWIQGFNSPDELLAIQDYVRRKKGREDRSAAVAARPRLKPSQYGTARQWIEKIEKRKPSLTRWLTRIYGTHEPLHEEKIGDLARVLQCYGKRFGFDEKVCLVRAPGRINLMGRHVDHRGGLTNFLAIDRETVAVAGLRDDDSVVALSTEPKKFKPVEFNIAEVIGRFAWSDWVNFIDSDWVRNMLNNTQGDWGNYIKAAVLRLQNQYQDVKVRGLNMAVHGNVPIAAGLSSSSTLVVATLQAAIALNNFELTSRQFIDLCGEGEWFVGSRGGAGDHAAIYLGQRGKIAHVGYLPFRVEKILDAPRGYQVVIANSHIQAAKSREAKHTFNAKVASYNLALELLKQRCPEIVPTVEYVRDLDPAKIGCSTSDLYRMFLKIPQFITRKELRAMFHADRHKWLETNFASHAEPEHYCLRGVLLFGAAEIMRSRVSVSLLEAGQVEEFGRLMKISHDGDRVSRPDAQGRYLPLEDGCNDDYFHRLLADLASEDPDRVLRAQLYMQPGSYACSRPEIDRMVDLACSVPGVVGAQIAGAGLGGCVMILARKEAVEEVRKTLLQHYYRPDGLKPAMLSCIATDGAGLAEF